MELLSGWQKLSSLLILLTYITVLTNAKSHHIRHHRDRFKRQQGANLFLPGSYVRDNNEPDAGPWSEWSSPSPCTRTCGGGVSTQQRQCTVGYACQGASKRHFTCNTQDCPDLADFRAQQCSEYDSRPFENIYYQWIPYTKSPQQCELNCMPRGERFYYRHKLQVIDGTRCDEESLNVCVEGKCQPVGCDMMLGSDAREDKCRACNGDGSTCNTLSGTLDMQDLQVGYNDILLIPAGAVNINVREIAPSNNYLAVRNTTGHYYLNGNWRIDFPRTLDFADSKFHYDRSPQGFSAPDSISCQGPIDQALFVVLLYQDVNVGIEYEYSTPKTIRQPEETETYAWIFDQFSSCSATCGGGYQFRNVSCAGRKSLEPATPSLCDTDKKPPETQRCSETPCDPKWVAKDWENCTTPCGDGGVQTRKIICEQIISGGVPSIVDDQQCNNIQKPTVQQPCNQGVVCAEWHTGPWKPCDKLCGEGKETRKVTCFRKEKEKIVALQDSDCAHVEKPDAERKCMIRPCEGVDWVTSEWSGCEDKCGLTEETRQVQCATALGAVYDEKLCEDAEEKPPVSRKCENTDKGCEFEWFASQWSECSAKCGGGVQTRKVFCTSPTDNGFKKVKSEKCDPEKKYDEVKNCTAKEEVCPGEWFTGPWSKCSKECEGGVKTRKSICMRENITVTIKDCDKDLTPLSTEECNKKPCDKDEILPIESTAGADITESSVTKLPTKEKPEEDVELIEDDYELVDDEECEDGEFVIVDGNEQPQLSDKDKLIALGTSTELDKESKETTLALDELMMSDSTYVSDAYSSFSPDYGSGDYEFSKSTVDDLGSTAFDSSLVTEGSGDESTYFKTTDSYSTDPTAAEGSGSDTPIEVTEDVIQKEVAYTVSGEFSSDVSLTKAVTTSSADDVSEISTDKETTLESSEATTIAASDASIEDTTIGVTAATSDGTSEATTDVTTVDSSAATQESTDGTESGTSETTNVDETSTIETTDVTTETTTDFTEETTSDITEETTADTTRETTTESTTDLTSESIAETDETTPSGGTDEITSEVAVSSERSTKKDKLPEPIAEAGTSEEETTIRDASEFESISEVEPLSTETSAGLSTSSEGLTTDISSETVSSTDETKLSSIDATESATDSSGSTDRTSEGSTISGLTEAVTISSSVTDEGTTISGTTDEALTTESGASRLTEATEIVSTEEFTDISITSTTEDVWSTTELMHEWVDVFVPKGKHKMCKRRKTRGCKISEFGCCSDKVTTAHGPFNQGCPTPKTCNETKYGCCEDNVSPAKGKNYNGCPPSQCKETLFGCCPDNKTPAEGNDNEGCPPPPPACLKSKYGCCKDNITEAKDPDGRGCKEDEESVTTEETFSAISTTTEYEDCSNTTYGCCPDATSPAQGEYYKGCDIFKENCVDSYFHCCPDRKTSAQGPNYLGCEMECSKNPFGCCPDGITPAHGYYGEGCCLSSLYGCCPDNIKEAEGENFKGCGCQYSSYGCCPDNATIARGYHNEGCGCQYTEHGCCPDNYTPAAGQEYAGCLCHTFQFGCCPDGVTVAKGPHQQGCGCKNTEFGCCSDDETPARGSNFEGCDCASSKHGCCIDGVTEAQGDNFDGCPEIPENLQASCFQEKERGPCRNYTVKWFYDMSYGGCSRFWYGGCEGNGNRFKDKAECHNVCVEPHGKDRCNLPMVKGPCEGYYPHWYYDKDRNHCAQFIYGGCLGNNNRFETVEECNNLCVKDRNIDACEQPKEEGTCRGNYHRWHYNKEEGSCQLFRYGGCQGNNNNFHTEEACKQKCAQLGRKKEHCSLPRAQGNCTERQSHWYYDATERRCMPFYYSGCNGNHNNFVSQDQCEVDCPKDIVKDTCQLPADVGECSDYKERWYYDTARKQCLQFYYGNCGGNGNNFETEDYCQRRCASPPATEAPQPEPSQPQPPQPEIPTQTEGPRQEIEEPFRTEFCFEPSESGTCRKSEARWFYDRDGACKQFLYGGCEANRNNFKTDKECQHYCGNAQDICTLPKLVGPCSAEYERYYYNHSTDSCELFKYGGCMGNGNNFEDQLSCEQRCRRAPPTVTEGPAIPPVEPPTEDLMNICYKPVDTGNCTDNVPAYYYEPREQRCVSFTYTGCGGNANRYTTEEQCERQCGRFRGQDVCSLPKDQGPCKTFQWKYHYDSASGKCTAYLYGGCEGNGNRFSTIEDCESICVTREETKPDQPSREICLLPADTGNCRAGHHRRWYFDEQKGECIVFIYSGCGGNFNRFKSYQSCFDTCRDYMAPTYPELNTEPSVTENPCQKYYDECKSIRCPYGIKAYVDDTQCHRCKCYNPCDDMSCPAGTQCGVDLNLERTENDDANFIGVCRQMNKPGDCPSLSYTNICDQECQTDADCSSAEKCCSNGCGTVCVQPFVGTAAPPGELRTTSSILPAYTEAPSGYYPPQIIDEEFIPEVSAAVGEYATLRCAVSGNPTPTFTWQKENLLIDGKEPRYRILLDGAALQIISLYVSDAGIYLCTADNSIGDPVVKEIRLDVQDTGIRPAKVLEDPDLSTVTVSLGSPATLKCYVYGNPQPTVMWWRDDELLPFKNEEFTINEDKSLFIHSVRLSNLGIYTCQAYNGEGRASSWAVTVQALGPVYSTDENDRKYLKYVIDRPQRETASHPMYPFRPTRITPTAHTTLIPPRPVPTTIPPTPRPRPVYTVPVQANITLTDTRFPIRSDINIPCDVDGYPTPNVEWLKDGETIEPSKRIEITDSHRLIIRNANESDSGEYRCRAWNQYTSASSTTPLRVEGRAIHPNCTDNPFFANCKLIVEGNFCKHKYYARFCCHSCTEAGQLDAYNSHMQDQPSASIESNLV